MTQRRDDLTRGYRWVQDWLGKHLEWPALVSSHRSSNESCWPSIMA
jgi:hypothetical protein